MAKGDRILKLTKDEAKRQYPGYTNRPSIAASGSIRGMRKLYRWEGLVIRVGSYYYHIGKE
ncbi:MAG: hypothetical protein WC822_07190 [Candidatus Paceibacterota bacterium]|jgi:hypothetical protein